MPKKSSKETTSSSSRRMVKEDKGVGATGLAAIKVATLKELRKTTRHTQEELAITLDVGQGTISRIEKRDDMLVSTLQHYIEALGGKLQIVASFPDGPAVIVERLGKKNPLHQKAAKPVSTHAISPTDT